MERNNFIVPLHISRPIFTSTASLKHRLSLFQRQRIFPKNSILFHCRYIRKEIFSAPIFFSVSILSHKIRSILFIGGVQALLNSKAISHNEPQTHVFLHKLPSFQPLSRSWNTILTIPYQHLSRFLAINSGLYSSRNNTRGAKFPPFPKLEFFYQHFPH